MTVSPSVRRQTAQLLALTFAHTVADTYVGIIAPVIIPMRDRYGVSVAALIVITSLLAFSSNIFQIPVGQMRATRGTPLPICFGVLLAGVSVLIPSLPPGRFSVVGMAGLALLAGLGVAIIHPEGLRAIHGFDRLPSSLTTSLFMVSGFMGFAGGAMLSSALTERFGLASLRWLYAAAPVAALCLGGSGLRLPVENEMAVREATPPERIPGVPFAPLFIMAATLATCSQIQATLLPSYLHEEAGYSLSFSGFSFTLFGIGGMIGALVWGALAPRFGHLRVILYSALAGAPLTLLYLILAPRARAASILLAFTGFIVYTGFPLCITLARYASSSLRFTQRMGLVSGGSWGIAAVVMWILGPVSEHTGMGPLLHLIWVGYLVTVLLTRIEIRRQRPCA
ncbi:MAG: MFS transporter [Kiritimatiellia bacterium]|jgi:FSR family fosmidomycin resistance protein-like MFS transporter|nr:MFS transporter [Kiritimatiellia bacterium]